MKAWQVTRQGEPEDVLELAEVPTPGPGQLLVRVLAAAGGVGSAAVQLGKAAGARVIGVVGGPAKAAVARELGADVVIDRYQEDFVAVGLAGGAYKRRQPRELSDRHADLTKLAADGKIRTLVTERLPMADVPDGLRRLSEGSTVGRIVFIP